MRKEKERVYCGECKYYIPIKIMGMGYFGFVASDECSHPRSTEDSYYKEDDIRISPSKKNKYNSCSDFEPKKEKSQ